MINTKAEKYPKERAESIAATLQESDPEWTYEAAPSPVPGLYVVRVSTSDGRTVGYWNEG